jgi:serine/threonine protein kinase
VREKLIVESDFSLHSLSRQNCELWFYLIQLDAIGVHKKVEQYIAKYPSLAFAVDTDGRVGIDLATLPNKIAMLLKSECPYSFLAQNAFEMWFYLIKLKDEDVDKKVFEYVHLYQELAEAKNIDGFTALQEATPQNRMAIILASRRPLVEIFENQYEAWFQLIQFSGVDDVENVVSAYVEHFPELAYCKNAEGKLSIDCATPANRDAIRSIFLWHGRFDVLGKYPEYGSEACVVYRAIDESELDDNGMPCQVALKLFHSKSKLLGLWDTARKDFGEQYVMPVIDSFPPPGYDLSTFPDDVGGILRPDIYSAKSLLKKSEAESLYCAVMPYAEKNLFIAMKRDSFGCHASADPYSNRSALEVFTQVVEAVAHIHSKGQVHGNLVPVNICRYDERWMLQDMSSSVSFGSPVMKFKRYSSAYIPPEAIITDDSGVCFVRSSLGPNGIPGEDEGKLDYLRAHPSFDIWALGCILYQLVSPTSSQLFVGDANDDLTNSSNPNNCEDNFTNNENSLASLRSWNHAACGRKLSHLGHHHLAVNLLQGLLNPDPDKRPDASRVLSHPLLTGKPYTRLSGQHAEYDVYISYRECDGVIAKHLHKLLGEKNISVWWDKTCLLPNTSWREGFSAGLVNSSAMICLISRSAINNPDHASHNFGSYSEGSAADPMLLEFRLALELHSAGLLDAIFPVFIGDDVSSINGNELAPEMRVFGKYVAASTLPRAVNTVVEAVENELEACCQLECLGSPVHRAVTVSETLQRIVDFAGIMIEGEGATAFQTAIDSLSSMINLRKLRLLKKLGTDSSAGSFSPLGSNIVGNVIGTGSAYSTARDGANGGNHSLRMQRASFQDGLRGINAPKQSSFKGSSLNRSDSDKDRDAGLLSHRGVIPTIAPTITEAFSRRPSLSNDPTLTFTSNSLGIRNDNRKEIKEIAEILGRRLSGDRPDNDILEQAVSDSTSLRSKVSGLQDEVASLKATIQAKNAEIADLKEPHSREMSLLKEQLVLLSALEREMKTMAEKNKILRRQANKEMKALRDQLTVQVEENLKLKQELGITTASTVPIVLQGEVASKKPILPAISASIGLPRHGANR